MRLICDSTVYPVFQLPSALLCLTSLILARGLEENAFVGEYKNASDLYNRPDLGSVDYIELEWKEEIKEDIMFTMSYHNYNEKWHHGCRVSGFRELPNLYSIRRAAGARMDDDGKEPLRVVEII
jgi:hypothetical protein